MYKDETLKISWYSSPIMHLYKVRLCILVRVCGSCASTNARTSTGTQTSPHTNTHVQLCFRLSVFSAIIWDTAVFFFMIASWILCQQCGAYLNNTYIIYLKFYGYLSWFCIKLCSVWKVFLFDGGFYITVKNQRFLKPLCKFLIVGFLDPFLKGRIIFILRYWIIYKLDIIADYTGHICAWRKMTIYPKREYACWCWLYYLSCAVWAVISSLVLFVFLNNCIAEAVIVFAELLKSLLVVTVCGLVLILLL